MAENSFTSIGISVDQGSDYAPFIGNDSTLVEGCMNGEIVFELSESINPLMTRYAWVVDQRNDFIGKDALSTQKNNLKSEKNVDAENGSNYNYVGNRHKALYTLNWLSKHDTPDKKGKSAGFLFYENYYQLWSNINQTIPIFMETKISAEEDLRLVQERYNLGAATILDLLNAQVSLISANSSLVRSNYDEKKV